MSKIQVGVLFGGSSAEHEVSIMSASFILKAMHEEIYEGRLIGITKEGIWLDQESSRDGLLKGILKAKAGQELFSYDLLKDVDVVFPVLHGPFGEDGTIQGLLETLKIPYVGSGVLASSLGMDKEAMKISFSYHGLPQTQYLTLSSTALQEDREGIEERIIQELGFPCFVKPSNLGSSLGISQVRRPEDLPLALEKAFSFHEKILVEKGVKGRELECSLLGRYDPLVSLPGEVISSRDFYDYEAKYSEGLSRLVIPAPLPKDQVHLFQEIATRAYQAIYAYGLARVDFFLTEEGQILLNEINTIPGFTQFSMYPLLFKEMGIPEGELVHRLIQLAFRR